MTNFNLTNFNNHIVFSFQGKVILMDTGAPASVSNAAQIFFLGKNWNVEQNYLGLTTEKLSELVGTHIDVLLGADILSNYYLLIDLPNNIVAFSTNRIEVGGDTFHFETFMGIPIINFEFRCRRKAFLDTGAALSYLKADLFDGLTELGPKSDFYPGYGQFTTMTYEAIIEVANNPFKVVFGTLPNLLQETLLMAGVDGIIGYDFFNSFKVIINYPEKTITLINKEKV